MNGEKISRCLDALPDAMLEEAMKPYQPRSLGRHVVRIAAVAAVLALVMTWLLYWKKLCLADFSQRRRKRFVQYLLDFQLFTPNACVLWGAGIWRKMLMGSYLCATLELPSSQWKGANSDDGSRHEGFLIA